MATPTADAFADIIKKLLNKPYSEVKEKCIRSGYNYRTISIDGKSLMVTRDIDAYRLNFKIENDIVTEITMG
ncbi:MAG: hypothetical protein ABIP51_20095 [Bacteroidia bacterium]